MRFVFITLLALLLTPALIQGQTNGKTGVLVAGDMRLSYHGTADSLYFELSGPTKGWIALGFNDRDNIVGADLLMFCVRDGKVEFEDQYVERAGVHPADLSRGGKSNIRLLSAQEKNLRTHVRFSIPLQSGDARDFQHVWGESCYAILAWSVSDDFDHHSRMRKHVELDLDTKYRR